MPGLRTVVASYVQVDGAPGFGGLHGGLGGFVGAALG